MKLQFSLFLRVVCMLFGCLFFTLPAVSGGASRSLSPSWALLVLMVPEHRFSDYYYFHCLFLDEFSSAMIGDPPWSDSFESDRSQLVPLFWRSNSCASGLTGASQNEVCSLLHRVMLQEAMYLLVPVSFLHGISPILFAMVMMLWILCSWQVWYVMVEVMAILISGNLMVGILELAWVSILRFQFGCSAASLRWYGDIFLRVECCRSMFLCAWLYILGFLCNP